MTVNLTAGVEQKVQELRIERLFLFGRIGQGKGALMRRLMGQGVTCGPVSERG